MLDPSVQCLLSAFSNMKHRLFALPYQMIWLCRSRYAVTPVVGSLSPSEATESISWIYRYLYAESID